MRFAVVTFLVCLQAVSCTATETGNPVAEVRMSLTARSTDEGVTLDAPGNGIRIDAAWVVLGDLRFVQSERCDRMDDTHVDIEGPSVWDLLRSPAPVEFLVEATDYCRVRIPLDRAQALPPGAPAALLDHAILIRGARADGVAFELRSRLREELEVRSRAAPFALEDARASLVLSFDVAKWLEGVDLGAVASPGGEPIQIDEDTNDNVLRGFEDNVEAAMELFRDLDEDGLLDPHELSAPLASGAP